MLKGVPPKARGLVVAENDAAALRTIETLNNAGVKVAFSRHDGKKTYVQDLLKAEADRVRGLIDRGGIVYVCGDSGRMEPDVKRALAAMYDEAFVARLAADNRYVLDVWASS